MVPVRRTVPLAGRPSPASTRASVVLPAPFRPTKPILSPGPTWKLAASISSCAPARNSRPLATITRTHSPPIRCLIPRSPASRGAPSGQQLRREQQHAASLPAHLAIWLGGFRREEPGEVEAVDVGEALAGGEPVAGRLLLRGQRGDLALESGPLGCGDHHHAVPVGDHLVAGCHE